MFLLGIIVGMTLGITLIAILNAGAVADQWMEYNLNKMNNIK
jgi:hypothetical protein